MSIFFGRVFCHEFCESCRCLSAHHCFLPIPIHQDEAEKKALQSVVENNAEGQALYRDLTHDFAHHADVFKKSPGHDEWLRNMRNSDEFGGLEFGSS